MKQHYRYFGPLLHRQEAWLNRVASQGWRLEKVGKLCYTFSPCPPGAYQYRVEFVGHLSAGKSQEYQAFLKDLGYQVQTKNINLNWSLGKVRWRPYGEGLGQIATSPGGYNQELLLVEKENDGLPFQLHSTHADQAHYWGTLGKLWLTPALLFLAFAGWLALGEGAFPGAALLGLAGLVFLLPALSWSAKAGQAKKRAKIQDW